MSLTDLAFKNIGQRMDALTDAAKLVRAGLTNREQTHPYTVKIGKDTLTIAPSLRYTRGPNGEAILEMGGIEKPGASAKATTFDPPHTALASAEANYARLLPPGTTEVPRHTVMTAAVGYRKALYAARTPAEILAVARASNKPWTEGVMAEAFAKLDAHPRIGFEHRLEIANEGRGMLVPAGQRIYNTEHVAASKQLYRTAIAHARTTPELAKVAADARGPLNEEVVIEALNKQATLTHGFNATLGLASQSQALLFPQSRYGSLTSQARTTVTGFFGNALALAKTPQDFQALVAASEGQASLSDVNAQAKRAYAALQPTQAA